MKFYSVVMTTLLAGAVSVQAETFKGKAEILFDVHTTLGKLHSFTGKVASEPFEVTVDSDKINLEVSVVSTNMQTGNKKRDQEMFHMLHTDQHAKITGSAKDLSLEGLKKAAGEQKTAITPTLTIAGVSKPVEGELSGWKDDGKKITFSTKFTVSLKEFELKPPSVIGLIKVHDPVAVTAAFTLER